MWSTHTLNLLQRESSGNSKHQKGEWSLRFLLYSQTGQTYRATEMLLSSFKNLNINCFPEGKLLLLFFQKRERGEQAHYFELETHLSNEEQTLVLLIISLWTGIPGEEGKDVRPALVEGNREYKFLPPMKISDHSTEGKLSNTPIQILLQQCEKNGPSQLSISNNISKDDLVIIFFAEPEKTC